MREGPSHVHDGSTNSVTKTDTNKENLMNMDALAYASRIDHQLLISNHAIIVIPSPATWSDRLRAQLHRNHSRDLMKVSLDFANQSSRLQSRGR
jgi:hypothetical protein